MAPARFAVLTPGTDLLPLTKTNRMRESYRRVVKFVGDSNGATYAYVSMTWAKSRLSAESRCGRRRLQQSHAPNLVRG